MCLFFLYRLVLGQVKVSEKSNEITAIPKLLKILEIQGCIVTIDAMGTQKEIAQEIIERGGDYILSLKGNQGNIHQDVKQLFDWGLKTKFENIPYEAYSTINKGHVELRFVVTGFFQPWKISLMVSYGLVSREWVWLNQKSVNVIY